MKKIILLVISFLIALSLNSYPLETVKGQIISKFVVIVALTETSVSMEDPTIPSPNIVQFTISPGESWIWDSNQALFRNVTIASDFAILIAQGYSPEIIFSIPRQ